MAKSRTKNPSPATETAPVAAIPAPVGQTRRFTPRTAEERRQDVERRAYDLYVQRGKVPGFEQQDWLQAEREVYERDEGQKFG